MQQKKKSIADQQKEDAVLLQDGNSFIYEDQNCSVGSLDFTKENTDSKEPFTLEAE